MKKAPIWTLLVERGLVEDRKTAETWVMTGNVYANDMRIDKPGQLVKITDDIIVKGIDQKYVGKGGLKLEGALSDFHVNVEAVVAIDAGASTGGFTDCLLQHGAQKVYAVDVGFGRLAGKMQVDPRVIAMEKVNISDPALRDLDPRPSLATVDLSYLSLKKAIPIFAEILHGKGDLICLVKPLFEVADSSIRRTGIIDDPDIYRELLRDLADYINGLDYCVIGISHSHVTGNKGAREFFIMVSLNPDECQDIRLTDAEIDESIDNAVDAVMKLDVYNK
ncbi:TlyA family RNA methyltransferase [bacterium]|nr:TlyA family RNA methyltransferase [bacterium]